MVSMACIAKHFPKHASAVLCLAILLSSESLSLSHSVEKQACLSMPPDYGIHLQAFKPVFWFPIKILKNIKSSLCCKKKPFYTKKCFWAWSVCVERSLVARISYSTQVTGRFLGASQLMTHHCLLPLRYFPMHNLKRYAFNTYNLRSCHSQHMASSWLMACSHSLELWGPLAARFHMPPCSLGVSPSVCVCVCTVSAPFR